MGDKEEEKKADGAPAETGKKEQKVGKFVRGDHMVHIFIQKGKKFVPFVKDDQYLDLIVEVEVNG
jgi:hypothetical protein